jgi:predicted porin
MKALPWVLALSTASTLATAQPTVDTQVYGSLRLGFDVIDAGTDDDGGNGRDFLSRVGAKAELPLQPDLTAVAQVEYGTRAENGVDFKQNDGPGLRLANIGLKGRLGEVRVGSQTLVWHRFVRGAHFSDANDTLRQGTIRDDDLLQYYFTHGNVSIGASVQAEGQDGDTIDQYQLGGEYKQPMWKLQLALAKDERGDNTGKLWGARLWLMPASGVAFAAYQHRADADFDHYAGSTTGNVRLRDAAIEGDVKGVPSCLGEQRRSQGLYASYHFGNHQLHGRYAEDKCEDSGDVRSHKVEYVAHLHPQARVWLAYEQLDNDEGREPLSSSGDAMSAGQLGLRFDF